MNREQRMRNRHTADMNKIEKPCPECGMLERHWIGMPASLENIILGTDPEGFWTCPKFYGPDGKRINP